MRLLCTLDHEGRNALASGEVVVRALGRIEDHGTLLYARAQEEGDVKLWRGANAQLRGLADASRILLEALKGGVRSCH